jgi:hypothetical protein
MAATITATTAAIPRLPQAKAAPLYQAEATDARL